LSSSRCRQAFTAPHGGDRGLNSSSSSRGAVTISAGGGG
jgi:hypothetical protein